MQAYCMLGELAPEDPFEVRRTAPGSPLGIAKGSADWRSILVLIRFALVVWLNLRLASAVKTGQSLSRTNRKPLNASLQQTSRALPPGDFVATIDLQLARDEHWTCMT